MLVMIIFNADGVTDGRKAKLERWQMVTAARKAVRPTDAKNIECYVRISLRRNLVSVTHQRTAWPVIFAATIAPRHLPRQIFGCTNAFAKDAHDIINPASVGAQRAADNIIVQHGADFPATFLGGFGE